MTRVMQVLGLALPLLVLLAPAARAAAWQRVTGRTDTRDWDLGVLPSGVGYVTSGAAINSTQDGGKTWKILSPPKGISPGYYLTAGTGTTLLAFHTENNQEKTPFWTDASKKWTNVTVEVPKGVKPSYTEMAYIYAIPGVNQAVAAGSIETTAGSWVSCFWHWNGGATWKVTTMPRWMSGFAVASPTVAWMSFDKPGDILHWNGVSWLQYRKGAADESIDLLKAVPATAAAQAAVWGLLRKTANGRTSETLLLCDTTKCTAKKAAGTFGTIPGSFQAYQGFDAAANFALVWESLPSNNPNVTTVKLQQFEGSKWTTALTTVVRKVRYSDGFDRETPRLQVSVASPTRAVATLLHLPTAAGKSATLVTHTWNGSKWTQQANATFTAAEAGSYPRGKVQALTSGSALLTLESGMWRLA